MGLDPALPPPAPGEDVDDAAARHEAQVARAMKRASTRLRALSDRHGEGSVALANMGSRGVRIVYVAGDGTWGDVVVPTVAAADQVCAEGGWPISGWDTATTQRIAPSAADRRRMAGTGR
ncbi:hypothetical protein [Nakamurella deserti]|uniref:hypothetical protein n=1 Tax=Nakamurella deserti TaxID=2164074 RepID=UPI000DBE8638|nr:hypothetical protein [Nakamurella deserti]